MKRMAATVVVSAVAILGGCGVTVTGLGDIAVPEDLGIDLLPPPDLAPPPDLLPPPDLVPAYQTAIVVAELATRAVVNNKLTDIHTLAAAVTSPLPSHAKAPAFDGRSGGLGCWADAYDVARGHLPPPDEGLGRVVVSGFARGLKSLSGQAAPTEVDCIPDPDNYGCGWGPLSGGMLGPPLANLAFSVDSAILPVGGAVRVAFANGNLGSFDSMNQVTTTDTLTVTEDLAKITYDPGSSTTLHFTCAGPCAANVVLVQLVASSVVPGAPGYPGGSFGVVNCAALGNTGTVTIAKGALAVALGGTGLVAVTTRVIRSAVPLTLTDSKGYPVTVIAGHGVIGFAPR